MFRFGGTIKWCWLVFEGRFEPSSLKVVRILLFEGNFLSKFCLGYGV